MPSGHVSGKGRGGDFKPGKILSGVIRAWEQGTLSLGKEVPKLVLCHSYYFTLFIIKVSC